MTLATLISKPPATLANSVAGLKLRLQEYQQIASDPQVAIARRAAAIELLACQPFEAVRPTFAELLNGDQPGAVQAECINALSVLASKPAAEIVLTQWGQLRPNVRGQAISMLMRRTDTTQMALDAMTAGKMDGSGLSIDQRVLLLKHSDAAIRTQATKLFGGAVSANRRKVVDQYSVALSHEGSADDGKLVFTRVCATCHKRDGEGHEVGPDLSDVRNRSKSALMYEILDPNAKVEPRFSGYAVLTLDGQLFNGLLTTESADAVVLTLPGGKQQTIGRAEIDRMKVSNISLMPEGIEKDVTPQQMANLLEFLKSERHISQ
jgi:putative heme-binding domain-containing protein